MWQSYTVERMGTSYLKVWYHNIQVLPLGEYIGEFSLPATYAVPSGFTYTTQQWGDTWEFYDLLTAGKVIS